MRWSGELRTKRYEENLKGRHNLGDQGVDWRHTLKSFLKKHGMRMVWTGFT